MSSFTYIFNTLKFVPDCIHMDSAPGDYIYKSTGDYGDTVCGFYIIGHSDELIELEFNYFDVSCSNGGLLTVCNRRFPQFMIFDLIINLR